MLTNPSANTWANIATGSPNTLNIDTAQTTADLDLLSKVVTTQTHTVWVKATKTAVSYTQINVEVWDGCDCSQLTWTSPTEVTINASNTKIKSTGEPGYTYTF